MFDWLKSKKETTEESSPLQRSIQFIAEYRASDKQDQYAITLWGIVVAFNKIFGGVDEFNSAEPAKKNRYLQMVGANAIKSLEKGDMISASCNNFYMNYLIAINGSSRSALRGSIEQVADMLDGIVRRGDLKQKEIGATEEAIRESLTAEYTFKIGSGTVRGPVTERAVSDVSSIVFNDLQKILTTKEDYYWFMIEYHDLLLSQKSAVRTMLDGLPLFPVEYEGMRSADSYVGRPNPGVEYMASIRPAILNWCTKTVPSLDANQLSTRVLTAAYGHFRMAGKQALDVLRLEYAVHYHNNCVSNGSFQNADKWSEVIDALS